MRSGLIVRLILTGAVGLPTTWAQIDPSIWKTDVSRKSIALSELHLSVAKDRIPALDSPAVVTAAEAADWLDPREPVIVAVEGSEARAYPLRILLFHEIVNDQLGSVPIAVTFCPLCNTGLVFDRRVGGETLEFAVAGLLRQSDMVMYDRATESLWQQATGEALVGAHTGHRLKLLGGSTVPFETFQAAYPDGDVLSLRTGSSAPYGASHYVGYEPLGARDRESIGADQLNPKQRIVAVMVDGAVRAYPLNQLRGWGLVEGKIKSTRYVVFYEPRMLSAMDAERIVDSRAVGSAAAYSPLVDGKRLRFRRKGGRMVDRDTGSRWNVLGRCIEGPRAGARLDPVLSTVAFAFAWKQFYPHTRLVGALTIAE